MVEVTKEAIDMSKQIINDLCTFEGIRLLDVKCYMNNRYGKNEEPKGIYGNHISSEAQVDQLRNAIYNSLRLLEILYPNSDYVPHQNFRRIQDTELTFDNKLQARIAIKHLLDIINGKDTCEELNKRYIEQAEKFLQDNPIK